MNKKAIIRKIETFVYKQMSGEDTGHDWWHIDRVRKSAMKIAQREKRGDLFVIELAALTHDLDDWKFRNLGNRVNVGQVLKKAGADRSSIEHVLEITENISYKLGTNHYKMRTIEGMIVQDADRLDAIGAIGIARVFAFGAKFGREIHNPEKQYKKYRSINNINWATNTSIHHFEEKLLLVKDRMNTRVGKIIASKRHRFMEQFLKEFYNDWKNN